MNEMSTVCSRHDGYNVEIVVYSNDHIPAHAHINNLNHEEVCQVLIEDKIYNTFDDIHSYRSDITNELKKIIFDWCITIHKRYGILNFTRLLMAWNDQHPDDQI